MQQGTVYPSLYRYLSAMICIHARGHLDHEVEVQLLQAGSCTYASVGVVESNFVSYKMPGC